MSPIIIETDFADDLIAARAPESPILEFKATLPGRSDKDRAELLKDVSAFTNADGGTLIYGIAEKDGGAFRRSGVKLDDPDSEIRRISQIVDAGIEPRLASIVFRTSLSPEGDVLAIEVPKSFVGPHRYHFNGHTKFVKRTSTHASELSYDQLRASFTQSSQRVEGIRNQWRKQLTLDGLWRPMMAGPVCIVRIASVSADSNRQLIDPEVAYANWERLIFSDWMGGNRAFNYEGLVAYPGGSDDEMRGLVQVNRFGTISAYRTAGGRWKDQDTIPAKNVGDFIISAAKSLRNFASVVGLAGPAILNVGIVRVHGYSLISQDRYGFDDMTKATTASIVLPEVWIPDLSSDAPLDPHLKLGFDLIWQAFGRSNCPYFDSDGMWTPK